MTRPEIGGISPFFIVQDAAAALTFYRDQRDALGPDALAHGGASQSGNVVAALLAP